MAIAKPLSWGPKGVVQTIIPGEDLTPYIGYAGTDKKALFLREMMKGSDITPGPAKILLYRPEGTGGKKASVTVGGLTATALYEGDRGNDILILIQADPDREGRLVDISTVVSGSVVDEQTVSSVEELQDNPWIAFSGSGSEFTETAGAALTGGADPEISAADYAAFLTAIEPYQFDIIIYDGTDDTVIQAFSAFVKRMSNSIGHKCQAVMAEAQQANSEFVISVNNGVKLLDGTVLTAQQATWWLGGAEAGALYNDSLTYVQYPGTVEANPKLSDSQIDAAIRAGEIVFIDTFGVVKVCMDINTLTSFSIEKGAEFSKNRVMRVIHTFCNDVYERFSRYFIGKTDNNELGRNLLRGWIIGYLNEMQAGGGIQNFNAEDVTVSAGQSIDSVLIDVVLQPVDSIEKIYLTVTLFVNTSE